MLNQFTKLIDKWYAHEFSSGSYTGEDFIRFAKEFKAAMKKMCTESGLKLEMGKPGHYYLSGFITNGEKWVYFSTSDVRYSSGDWQRPLVRTAKHGKDYTGGANQYFDLQDLPTIIPKFFQ